MKAELHTPRPILWVHEMQTWNTSIYHFKRGGCSSGDSGDGRSSSRPIHNHDNWHTRLMRHLTTLFLEAGHLLLIAQFAKHAVQFAAHRDWEETELELQWKKIFGGGVVKDIFWQHHPTKYIFRHHAVGRPRDAVDGVSRRGGQLQVYSTTAVGSQGGVTPPGNWNT